jgi:HAD superfamily hydrolase (TIGR01509 family)
VEGARTIDAVLWDLDGVIVNSGSYHFQAYRWLLERHGVELTEDYFFSRLFGRRNWDILHDVLPGASEEEVHRLAEEKERKFRELVRGNIEALPGSIQLLNRAHDAGLKQSIVSSTPRLNIQMIVDSLGIFEYLDAVVGEEDSKRGKPDPEPFMVAADRLGVAYERCVVIEDAPDGVRAGKAAGMRVIGVATTRSPELLAEADLVTPDLEDERVLSFIGGNVDG